MNSSYNKYDAFLHPFQIYLFVYRSDIFDAFGSALASQKQFGHDQETEFIFRIK